MKTLKSMNKNVLKALRSLIDDPGDPQVPTYKTLSTPNAPKSKFQTP
jgi:hypothetical protein